MVRAIPLQLRNGRREVNVTLTAEQYGAVMHTITEIAYGRQQNGKRLTRDEMINDARAVCAVMKWSYTRPTPTTGGSSDGR